MASRRLYGILICLVVFSGCQTVNPHPPSTLTVSPPILSTAISPTLDVQPTNTPPTISSTEINTFINWQDLPIIPSLSPEAQAIYEYGLTLGNNPKAFTKIGDGEISTNWFLKIYDRDSSNYHLGPYDHLDQTIEYFSGSFSHNSQAAKRGYNTTKILDPKLADKAVCQKGETPLDCEIRIYRPSFAIISMGTNQVWEAETFTQGLRVIIVTLIKNGVVPILSTKADNLEGSNRINNAIARLAEEYHLPLWNFWRVCQDLPHRGLQEDQEHLTYIKSYDFSDSNAMSYAWSNRNLTALQVLEMLYLSLSSH